MTTIKTADLHLELPRPTPPDMTIRAVDDGWGVFTKNERALLANSTGALCRWWPTREAALDAAWQAYAADMAAMMAGQFNRMIDALEPIEKAAALAAEARRRRAADLHQCEQCRTTYRGQAPAYLVLEEHTLVDVEDPTGGVVYSGEASGWAPSLVRSLVARLRSELEAAQADHRRALATRDVEHAAALAAGRLWSQILLAVAVLLVTLAISRG